MWSTLHILGSSLGWILGALLHLFGGAAVTTEDVPREVWGAWCAASFHVPAFRAGAHRAPT